MSTLNLNTERVHAFATMQQGALSRLALAGMLDTSRVDTTTESAVLASSFALEVDSYGNVIAPRSERGSNNVGVLMLQPSDDLAKLNFSPYLADLPTEQYRQVISQPDHSSLDIQVLAEFAHQLQAAPDITMPVGATGANLCARLLYRSASDELRLLMSRNAIMISTEVLGYDEVIHESSHAAFWKQMAHKSLELFLQDNPLTMATWTERNAYRYYNDYRRAVGERGSADKAASQARLIDYIAGMTGTSYMVPDLADDVDIVLDRPETVPEFWEINQYNAGGALHTV